MSTNLHLDHNLIEQARKLGGHKTKRAAVNAALEAYVKRQQRLALLKAEGTIDFWPGFDHKQLRKGAKN